MIKPTDITKRALELIASKPASLSPQALAVIQAVTEAFNSELSKLKPVRNPPSDGDWLKDLCASPAYQGIDVMAQYEKCKVWCAAAGHQPPSKMRLVNWLNKVDRPLQVTSTAPGRAVLPEWAPTQAMLKAYAHEKWPGMDLTVFIISYHQHRSGKGWKINNHAVDWKIDFSEQVNKKRGA